MPRISDLIPINNEKLDKRVKLTKEQKQTILSIREKEALSYQKIADMFNVSKRTIIFICKPETLAQSLKRRQERGGSKIYYDKTKNTDSMRKHREYKKMLYSKNLI